MRFTTLDAMRGIAAVCVMYFHSGHPNPHGYLAVDLFFIMSGFVLSHAYGAKLRTGMTLRAFAVARLIRLYPLFLVGCVLGLVLIGGSPLMLLGIPTYRIPLELYPGNNPLWSVVGEMFASLVFAALIWSRRRIWGLVGATCGLAFLFGILKFGNASFGPDWIFLAYALPRIVFSFVVGMVLHTIFIRHGSQQVTPFAWALPILFASLTFAPEGEPWFDALAVFIALPAMVYLGACCAVPQPKLAHWLGLVSFPLYAIHEPILRFAKDLPLIPVMFGCVALAYALARFYDEPVRNWLESIAKAPVKSANLVPKFLYLNKKASEVDCKALIEG